MLNSDKKIILIDPTSIHHGPPESIKETDDFINKQYVDRINEVVDSICPENENKALHGKYITNYGLLMLSTLLKKDYTKVDYDNGDYYSSNKEYLEHLKEIISNYDLACLTSTTPQFNEVLEIAKALKKVKPDIKIIFGGPHSRYYLTHDPEECFDSTCIGYGIDKSKEVANQLLNGEEVPKKVITNYYYDVEKDFSVIPKEKIGSTMLYSYINFGCPNDCKYCVEHKFVDKIAFNDCPKKFDEIRKLVSEYNVRFVHIADSDFLIHRPTIEKFIDFIKTSGLNFCFSINTSPITLHKYVGDDILVKLKEVGLVEILIGAEHFSKKVLDNLAKVYNIDDFIEALYYTKRIVNIPVVSLYTLVGLPNEHEEEIKENIAVISKLKQEGLYDFTFPKFFVPYPDSEIYLHPEKYDVTIKNENWNEYQRWQLPRPIIINGMDDEAYVNEIIEINRISMEEYKNENNRGPSLCKKRQ